MPAGTAAAPKDVTETLDSMLREVDTVPVPQPHSQQNESSRDVTQPAVPAIHPAPAAVTPQPPAPPVIQQEVVQPVSQNVDAVQTVESLRDVPTSGTSRTVNSESSATQPAAGPNHQENTPFVPVAPAITAEKPPYPTPVSPVPQPPISPEPVEISPALKNAPVQPRSQSVDSSATQPPTAWAVEPVASVSSNIAVAEPSRPQPADTRQGVSQPWERAYDTPALGKKTGSINPTVDDSSGGIPANSSLSLRSREVEESPDIGRLVELDESAVSTDGVKPQTRPEFITDPMSRGTVAEEEPEIQTDEAPTIADPKPVGKDQEIVVPVFISRSQVNKTIPLKLRLEIRVIDE
jgi:hypothetical protein